MNKHLLKTSNMINYNNRRKDIVKTESELFKDTFKEIYKIDFNYVEIKPLEWEDIIKGAIEYFNVKSNHHECEDMEYNEDESIDSTFTDESVINPN